MGDEQVWACCQSFPISFKDQKIQLSSLFSLLVPLVDLRSYIQTLPNSNFFKLIKEHFVSLLKKGREKYTNDKWLAEGQQLSDTPHRSGLLMSSLMPVLCKQPKFILVFWLLFKNSNLSHLFLVAPSGFHHLFFLLLLPSFKYIFPQAYYLAILLFSLPKVNLILMFSNNFLRAARSLKQTFEVSTLWQAIAPSISFVTQA